MKRRVVVTGLGVVSALGTEIDEFWNAIKEGKCRNNYGNEVRCIKHANKSCS